MSAHVYGDGKTKLIGGWKVSSANVGIDKERYNDKGSGFKSQMYERTVGGVTEYTYATAGTEFTSIKDWVANATQTVGMSRQYKISVDNAGYISRSLKSKELTFVGHSLGGGEAALNAMATGRKALTFNAAGVSDLTKVKHGVSIIKGYTDIIDAYIMKTDPLNRIQNDLNSLPSVDGKRHYLNPVKTSGWYNGHSINSIIDHYDAKARELTPQQKQDVQSGQQQYNPNMSW